MKKYSVLLLYPDYVASNYGEETYYDFVEAKSPRDAVIVAQVAACLHNELDPKEQHDDFAALLVIEGHHMGLDPEEK